MIRLSPAGGGFSVVCGAFDGLKRGGEQVPA